MSTETLRSLRTWLVGGLVVLGAAAWLAVAAASHKFLEYSGHLGVVGMALVIGTTEVVYLVWRNWTLEQHGPKYASAGGAALGSLLILVSALGNIAEHGFALLAAGVGLLGLATATGLLGVYRSTGKSTPATMTALVITLALAYFASVLWAAVP